MASPLDRWMETLPVGEAVPALRAALDERGAAVLQAPPGAGKTTLVPLVLRDAAWLAGKRILMLEPRRLAARAAARRMADMLGEPVGETVGYRTRLESRVGPRTRIEVLTEGILIRLLQTDPALEGTGLVIFDEFHERSLDGDLGLALALEARRYLRPDLRLLVMSATLDGAPVARLLEDAPIISSAGRTYEVAVHHLERPPPERFAAAVAGAIRRALAEESGSLLVFLPGGAEIRRVARLLEETPLDRSVLVTPLYGDLPAAAQDAAIRPAPEGHRKIVLATSIAETSLTIEGIGVVIDGGLMRVPRYEPQSGMTRLQTVRVSQASAEQRRGRAGRLGPGVCYRLWPAAEQAQLQPFSTPEILEADLTPLALTLALWGNDDPAALSWLDPPPAAAYSEARALLHRLGALDERQKITAQGRAMAALSAHPRLAHMMLMGKSWGMGELACAVAALLAERDIVKAPPERRDADLRLRVEMIKGAGAASLPAELSIDRGALDGVKRAMRQVAQQLRLPREDAFPVAATGRLLAQAYPDRIGQRRPAARGQFRLANGRGAELPPADPLAGEEFLSIADLDGERRSARIFLAAPISRADIETDFAALIETSDTVVWDDRDAAVTARRQRRLDSLVLADEPLINPSPDQVAAALAEGIRRLGIGALSWQGAAANLRDRVRFARRHEGEGAGWPDFSEEFLSATIEEWLAPYLRGVMRRSQFAEIPLAAALAGRLSPDQRRRLDLLAPTHVIVPSGSRIPVDYDDPGTPKLAVRLQELFGAHQTPAIAAGRVPLVLQLLSPAGRPLQVTRDLAGFWVSSYPEVRRAMRGRYPKHPWPEDPRTALPTARAKRSLPRS